MRVPIADRARRSAEAAEARARLEATEASRARVVAAADAERRHMARDLHDGAQQRLVQSVVVLKLTLTSLQHGNNDVEELVSEALQAAEAAHQELGDLVRGILPPVLKRGGLEAGVKSLASRSPVPVDVEVSVPRLEPTVEAAGYFVIAEALTNVAKHAQAQRARVKALLDDGVLRLEIADDGVGGADPNGGGLLGLDDRVAALDGELQVYSNGGGTRIAATIPTRRPAERAEALQGDRPSG